MSNFILGVIVLAAATGLIGFAFYRASRPSRYQRSDISNASSTPGITSLMRDR